MPKRRNPFGDCSPLQFKTHVGQKELSDGISGKEQLKSVYEKTRQMLFSGAQKSSTSAMVTDANDNHIAFPCLSPPQTVPVTTLPGQMCLDQCGQLTVPSQEQMCVDQLPQTVPSTSPPGRDPPTLPGQLCLDPTGQLTVPARQEQMNADPTRQPPPKSFDFFNLKGKGKFPAQKNRYPKRSKCCFCEKMVDRDTVQQCCACQGDFCQLCSTINYDECMERTFCLNCNS